MSKAFLICQIFLLKVLGQRVEIMRQCGDPQNQPKAGPVAKVRESASHHLQLGCKVPLIKNPDPGAELPTSAREAAYTTNTTTKGIPATTRRRR